MMVWVTLLAQIIAMGLVMEKKTYLRDGKSGGAMSTGELAIHRKPGWAGLLWAMPGHRASSGAPWLQLPPFRDAPSPAVTHTAGWNVLDFLVVVSGFVNLAV